MVLPNIELKQSTIGITLDPAWSQNHEDNWVLLDNHDHTPGKGIQITPQAININENFSMNNFDLIDLHSPIFNNLSADPSSICALYFKNGNLWLNNGSGAHVQVSNGSGLNVSVGFANLYETVLTSINKTIYSADTYTFIEVNTTTPISLFLPSASSVSAGRFYYIKDITGLSGSNAITLVPTGGNKIDTSTSNYTMKRNFGSWLVISDGSSNWYVLNFSNKEINDGFWFSSGQNMQINAFSNAFTLKNDNNTDAFTLYSDGNIDIAQGKSEAVINIGYDAGTQYLNLHTITKLFKNTIIGDSSSYTLTVNANSTFNGTINTKNTVVIGDNESTTCYVNSAILASGDIVFSNISGNTFRCDMPTSIFASVILGNTSADALGVYATSNFLANVVFSGSVLLSNATTTTINNTLNISGTVNITGIANISSTTNITGGTTISAPLTISGATSLTNIITKSGIGRLSQRYTSSNASTITAGPNTTDIIRYSGNSSTVTINIDDTGAQDNDYIIFAIDATGSGTQTITIKNPSAITIGTISIAAPDKITKSAIRISGSWVYLG